MNIEEILEQLEALEVSSALTSEIEIRTLNGDEFVVNTVAYQNGKVVLFVS